MGSSLKLCLSFPPSCANTNYVLPSLLPELFHYSAPRIPCSYKLLSLLSLCELLISDRGACVFHGLIHHCAEHTVGRGIKCDNGLGR